MASRSELGLGEVDEDDEFEDLEDEEDVFDGEPEGDEEEDEYLSPLSPDDTVELLAAARDQAAPRWFGADGMVHMPTEMRCRVCGCTEMNACPGGCLWAAPNLCSRCTA